jgi:glyoxylase-like metal-dependent hydrolase (beta-lactamase superfamily II)
MAKTASNSNKSYPLQGAGYYRFALGDWEAISINDGALNFDPMKAFLAPDAPDDEYKATVFRHFREKDESYSHINALYLDTGKNKILIDSGDGPFAGLTAGHLLTNLSRAGVQPEEIDTVIFSHAHADHICGAVDPQGKRVFPNARYFIGEAEYKYWTAKDVPIGSRFPDEMKNMLLQAALFQLNGIKNDLSFIQPRQEVLPGITTVDASGHTVGQVAFRIERNGESLFYTADTMHTTAVSMEHPEWVNGFDNDGQLGIATRKRFLDHFATDRSLIIVPHFPFPALGYIARRLTAYAFEPLNWHW